jgi:hypothetical protein
MLQAPCAGGKWSAQASKGDVCTSLCDAGFVCAPGSSSPTPLACGGSQYFCPQGSAVASVVGVGNYTTGGVNDSTRTSQVVCPSPSDSSSNGTAVYCPGNGRVHVCPAGVFGSAAGLSSATCSGPCRAGYYCPAGSVNATAVPCGAVDKYVLLCFLFSSVYSIARLFA